PGLNAFQIRQEARLDYESTDVILEKLEQDGIVIRTRQIVPQGRTRFRNDDLWLFAADASVVRLDRVFRLFAFDAEHVSEMALDSDDPLAVFVRRQKLANGDETLDRVFGYAGEPKIVESGAGPEVLAAA
ncbi:MAG: hypothetical protein ABI277_10355, partial [Burkholderiaceae bacterium]